MAEEAETFSEELQNFQAEIGEKVSVLRAQLIKERLKDISVDPSVNMETLINIDLFLENLPERILEPVYIHRPVPQSQIDTIDYALTEQSFSDNFSQPLVFEEGTIFRVYGKLSNPGENGVSYSYTTPGGKHIIFEVNPIPSRNDFGMITEVEEYKGKKFHRAKVLTSEEALEELQKAKNSIVNRKAADLSEREDDSEILWEDDFEDALFDQSPPENLDLYDSALDAFTMYDKLSDGRIYYTIHKDGSLSIGRKEGDCFRVHDPSNFLACDEGEALLHVADKGVHISQENVSFDNFSLFGLDSVMTNGSAYDTQTVRQIMDKVTLPNSFHDEEDQPIYGTDTLAVCISKYLK